MKKGQPIVGASVAGLVADYHLARGGVPVHVYDAQTTFAPDPRTLIVAPAWLRLLDLMDLNVEETMLNCTHAFQAISRGTSVRISLREPDLILDRPRFLRLLACAFRQVGGRLTPGHRLEEMVDGASSPRLQFRNGKVTTVGGLVMGMRGATAAARAILNHSRYGAELRALHWELNAHDLVRRMLDAFPDEDYDRLLRSLNEKVLHTLERYNRDEWTHILWRLLPSQPRWLLLGTRGLLGTSPGGP